MVQWHVSDKYETSTLNSTDKTEAESQPYTVLFINDIHTVNGRLINRFGVIYHFFFITHESNALSLYLGIR